MSESPIRILHILGSIQRGGTEAVVFNNYQHIDRDIVQFDIAVHNNSPCDIPQYIIDMGCRVFYIPSYTKQPAYIIAIRDICEKNNYKIIHSHMNSMSIFALFAAWLARVPIRISHSHSAAAMGRGEVKRNILKYILRPFSKVFATHYFACSDYAARWLFGNKTVDKGKVMVLKNAICLQNFSFNLKKRKEIREQLKVQGKFVVGHVGRMSPPKNHLFLIDIFNIVLKKRKDAYLLLIGGIGSAGNGIEKKLMKKIHDYNLSGKVSFLGSREDVCNLYQAMDVFVMPSLYEGLGIACVEAQVSGLPCVVSDRVPREVQINNNVKFLSLKEPIDKWACEVINSQGKRGNYANNIGAAGYDIHKVAKNLEHTYLEYIAELKGLARE